MNEMIQVIAFMGGPGTTLSVSVSQCEVSQRWFVNNVEVPLLDALKLALKIGFVLELQRISENIIKLRLQK